MLNNQCLLYEMALLILQNLTKDELGMYHVLFCHWRSMTASDITFSPETSFYITEPPSPLLFVSYPTTGGGCGGSRSLYMWWCRTLQYMLTQHPEVDVTMKTKGGATLFMHTSWSTVTHIQNNTSTSQHHGGRGLVNPVGQLLVQSRVLYLQMVGPVPTGS